MTIFNNNNGKILRLKIGYNPNSSSIGSNIPAFLSFAIGSSAVSVFILNLINAADKKIRKKRDEEIENEKSAS
jgi:hypothetical protein